MKIDEYVRVCPRCGHENPEWHEICQSPDCDGFLGVVNPSPRIRREPHPTPDHPSFPQEISQKDASVDPGVGVSVTTRLPEVLYLEYQGTSKVVEIRSGQVVGQAHPSSQADVQLSDIPNINFVSRQHCLFICENGRWFVTAIPTATNPTYLNQKLVPKGAKAPLSNGDYLVMANVPFTVRIIS